MKKVFDQTVRDIKREVNKKMLKVPGIEQKVLDSTSNEPWGPHGSLLADIAQASRNYYEYQMIMAVIWKRINDTGKNWRHVYKALIVLEYLVGHGSERVIEDIREHAYQINALSSFQYIDSSARDQGNNVRRKSQALVILVNDKEMIFEVREKAAANRDKFRNTPSGGTYRPSSYGDRFEEERYGNRAYERNGYGYGREREYNYRDDDQYGRYGDSSSRDGDRYGRDYEERSGRDDDHRGRGQIINGDGPTNRSIDRDRDRSFDDDSQSPSRGSGARADDQYADGRQNERRYSEQNIGTPPSYEEAVSESQRTPHTERNGETLENSPPGASPPVPSVAFPPAPKAASPPASNYPAQTPSASQEVEVVDEFDPRGPVLASAAPTAFNDTEMDLLGSLSDSFTPNLLAIMPASAADTQTNFSGSTFDATQSVSGVTSESFEDPFGDSPFKAVPSPETGSVLQPASVAANHFQPTTIQNVEMPHATGPVADTMNNFDVGSTFTGMSYSIANVQPPSTNSQFLAQELSTPHQETDILADILPPSDSFHVASQAGFAAATGQHAQPAVGMYGNLSSLPGSAYPVTLGMGPQPPHISSGNFLPQGVSAGSMPFQMNMQTPNGSAPQLNNGNLLPQQGFDASGFSQIAPASGPVTQPNNHFLSQQRAPAASQFTYQTPAASPALQNNDVLANLLLPGPNAPKVSQPGLPSSTGSLDLVPQPSKDKFETKSTVWADTLNRGLVNLNISGPKINPLSDIGIDFDAINRKEKRMEKPSTAAVTSTVTMGKAMGSGSGIGRAGAGALRSPSNPMMGSGMGMGAGMNMGMAGGPASGMGMVGYGGTNQPMGMGMGIGGQMPYGVNMPGGYNPMMGRGGYPQQSYGGGYR